MQLSPAKQAQRDDERRQAIICGGRKFADRQAVRLLVLSLDKDTLIITGGAPGADRLADQVAEEFGFARVICPANWRRYGRSAGMRRNALMLELFHPDAVYALPGGTGTADMCRQAERAGVPVHRIEPA